MRLHSALHRALGAALALLIPAEPAHTADAGLIARAEREGHVRWYTTLLVEDAVRPLLDAFKRRHPGIEVEFVRASSSENARKIVAEAQAGAARADVFDGTTTAAVLMQAGLVEPYRPEAARDIPDRYKDPDGHWTAQVLYFQTLGYNADLVAAPDVPKTFQELLDPRWRGKIAWSVDDGLTSGAGFVANVLLTMGETNGRAYLVELKTQEIGAIRGGGNAVLKAVAAKTYPLGLQIFNHHILIERAKGTNVDWVKLEPLMGFSNNIGLLRNAPHPNAGRLLIDFILSTDGQTVLRQSHHLPASTQVDASDVRLKTGFRVNFISPAIAAEHMQTWQSIFNELIR
jgi:ABC-type Fe3+ transport system substrate-binding protein